jgi:hypothetical protein
MERLPRTQLLTHHGGRHFVSEPHIRIQVLPVPVGAATGESLFGRYHGELLIHCLQGACLVITHGESCQLAEGDQAVLLDGEAFRIDRVEDAPGVVELVWTPGSNPCRTCWENNGRFFGAAPAASEPDGGMEEPGTGHSPLSDDDLAAVGARATAASPGPWRSFIEGRDHTSGSDFIRTGREASRGNDIELSGATKADQEFIARARQDVPRLLAEVDRLRRLLQRGGR